MKFYSEPMATFASIHYFHWSGQKIFFPEVLSDKWLLHLCGFYVSLLECFVSSQAGVFLMPYFPLRLDKWIWEWNVPPCDDETFTTAELRCICFKEALRLNNFSTQTFLNPQLPIHSRVSQMPIFWKITNPRVVSAGIGPKTSSQTKKFQKEYI